MNDLRPNTGCPNTEAVKPVAVKSNCNPKGCP